MCVDCFSSCNGEIISDRCVKYTGPDIPLLGIKKGDSISIAEQIIIVKLLTALDGTGITVSDVTVTGNFLSAILGTGGKTLVNLLQMLSTASTTLDDRLSDVEDILTAPFSFTSTCLAGLPAVPTRDDVLKAVAAKLCSVSSDVDAIKADYVKATQLNTLIAQYLTTATPATTQQNVKMVPFTALPYFGSLSNFDSTGKGLSANGFEKVYLCNGANGTPDMRGRVPVGAVLNVPGPALDAAVDPSLPANPNTNIAVKGKMGSYYVTLDVTQIPSHTHGVTDPGHRHLTSGGWVLYAGDDGVGNSLNNNGDDAVDFDTKTQDGLQNTTTGISIQNAGGGLAHSNIQPSIGALYIMYIP